jgi:membrane protein YdbS with pleckstrin-like domain
MTNRVQKNENIILLVTVAVFLFFAIASLWMLLNTKIVALTNSELIICRPLLFLHKSIPLIQITSIRQSDAPVEISQNFRTTTIYTGKKTILQLTNGDKIKISSMEIGGYKVLIKEIIKAAGKIKRNY